jgi:thiamine biosynthesis lipoprotein ApbE
MSMTLFEYLMVEMTVSCSNQLTGFPVHYLLHSVSVLAEVLGFHDELAAWEFVAAAAAAAAVKNIEQYLAYLQNHKNDVKFSNIPFTFETNIASNCLCKQLKRLSSIC